jgi:hypothetical protein
MKAFFSRIKWLFIICVLMVSAVKAADELLIGEGNDGNRSGPVHVIELYDDQGKQIKASDTKPMPFSLKQTCGKCHNYKKISSGWHFNASDPNVPAGRPGEPWVLVDSKTRTQIPLSGRKWPGTFTSQQVGMSAWDFLKNYYSHFPGGSYGEMVSEEPDVMIRKEISRDYEINCLACHNNSPLEDQSMAALQSARQNYRWIPAASSGKAVVNGVAASLSDFFNPDVDEGVAITYAPGIFDKENKVFFDVSGKPLNDRCYFCHSNQDLRVNEEQEWIRDEDVHLNNGLTCVDCHRNGDDHMIVRGIEVAGAQKSLTCEGCHIGPGEDVRPEQGRLGAPKPKHAGIPTIHFEKMTCTACHSGTWPEETAGRWKTARIHKTGLHGKHDLDIAQPYVYAPVLMRGADGKIGPYKMFWPAYWATIQDNAIVPMDPKEVFSAAKSILEKEGEKTDDWRPLTEEEIAAVLNILKTDKKNVIYIAGGSRYGLNEKGVLERSPADAARAYAWPMAHDVRPAAQAMGVRLCKDCHTTDSAFFFSKVQVDTPVKKAGGGLEFVEMVKLQGIDRLYMWVFNFSFVFRPFLKIIAFASCGLIGVVVLAYFLRAVTVISDACAEEAE